jgi:hypothetical protein
VTSAPRSGCRIPQAIIVVNRVSTTKTLARVHKNERASEAVEPTARLAVSEVAGLFNGLAPGLELSDVGPVPSQKKLWGGLNLFWGRCD